MARLVLASSSPRRKEILNLVYHSFEIIVSQADETVDASLTPEETVTLLAEKKAKIVAESNPDAYCIGADTIVYLSPHILGKPADKLEAKKMLKQLSGQTHTVYTGTSVVFQDKVESFFEKTDVTFWNLAEKEIDKYIETGEPFDKAGGYGIQGMGATLVKSINGDFFSVVGLPISRLYRVLQNMGYREETDNYTVIND